MKRIVISILGVCLLALAGCGGEKSSTASGKVTAGGQPAGDAIINFVNPKTGGVASSDLDAGGAYKITEGLHPGSYKVFIVPKSQMTKPPMPGEPPPTAVPSKIGPKYQSESSSGLSAEIKPGANDNLDFKLD